MRAGSVHKKMLAIPVTVWPSFMVEVRQHWFSTPASDRIRVQDRQVHARCSAVTARLC